MLKKTNRRMGSWKPRQERALRKRELPSVRKIDEKVRTEKSTEFGNTEITGDLDLRSVRRKMQTQTGVECKEKKTSIRKCIQ